MGNQRTSILATIRSIPRGKVATYGSVAKAAGFPGAARQVAWALHGCGPDIPWQRVVGSGGKILLKETPALEQRLRLQSEGVSFRGDRVAMDRHEFRFAKTRKRASA